MAYKVKGHFDTSYILVEDTDVLYFKINNYLHLVRNKKFWYIFELIMKSLIRSNLLVMTCFSKFCVKMFRTLVARQLRTTPNKSQVLTLCCHC